MKLSGRIEIEAKYQEKTINDINDRNPKKDQLLIFDKK